MSSATIEYNWLQDEEQIIVDMIRADNQNRPLVPDEVSFDLPSPITPTPTETYNTTVQVSAVPGARFKGSQLHYYHRVPLAGFVFEGSTDLTFILEDYPTRESVITEVGNRLGIKLKPEHAVFTYTGQPGEQTFSVHPDSLCYVGSITLTFRNAAVDLTTIMPNTAFTGFNH